MSISSDRDPYLVKKKKRSGRNLWVTGNIYNFQNYGSFRNCPQTEKGCPVSPSFRPSQNAAYCEYLDIRRGDDSVLKQKSVNFKTDQIYHVWCNFEPRYARRTTLIQREGVNALSIMVRTYQFGSVSSKFCVIRP